MTQKELKMAVKYNKKTGLFLWRKTLSNRRKAGSKAGSVTNFGYLMISIHGSRYVAHRLAWLYVYGYMPEYDIDHIDGNKLNNSISNLRHVSRQCNTRNSKISSANTSGFNGVYYSISANKWNAYIDHDGSRYNLGYYKDRINAALARITAEECLGWMECNKLLENVKKLKSEW